MFNFIGRRLESGTKENQQETGEMMKIGLPGAKTGCIEHKQAVNSG